MRHTLGYSVCPACVDKPNTVTHTPTPWKLGTPGMGNGNSVFDSEGHYILDCKEADAAFIVLAVNCHEELLDFVKNARIELEKHGVLEYDRMYSKEDIENLIAKAEAR